MDQAPGESASHCSRVWNTHDFTSPRAAWKTAYVNNLSSVVSFCTRCQTGYARLSPIHNRHTNCHNRNTCAPWPVDKPPYLRNRSQLHTEYWSSTPGRSPSNREHLVHPSHKQPQSQTTYKVHEPVRCALRQDTLGRARLRGTFSKALRRELVVFNGIQSRGHWVLGRPKKHINFWRRCATATTS